MDDGLKTAGEVAVDDMLAGVNEDPESEAEVLVRLDERIIALEAQVQLLCWAQAQQITASNWTQFTSANDRVLPAFGRGWYVTDRPAFFPIEG